MNPFIVFGDSITFGDELADVPYEEAKNDPSEHAWPALLGATNFSYPGWIFLVYHLPNKPILQPDLVCYQRRVV